MFEYIAMLQKCGPQAWFYSELRDIENIKFRFREEVGFVGESLFRRFFKPVQRLKR